MTVFALILISWLRPPNGGFFSIRDAVFSIQGHTFLNVLCFWSTNFIRLQSIELLMSLLGKSGGVYERSTKVNFTN